QLPERLQQLGEAPGLAEVIRLRVFERRGVAARLEVGDRLGNDRVEVFHGSGAFASLRSSRTQTGKEKGRRFTPPSSVSFVQAREALACSAILLNAVLSCTARSASTLRSMSIDAFFSPFMNPL